MGASLHVGFYVRLCKKKKKFKDKIKTGLRFYVASFQATSNCDSILTFSFYEGHIPPNTLRRTTCRVTKPKMCAHLGPIYTSLLNQKAITHSTGDTGRALDEVLFEQSNPAFLFPSQAKRQPFLSGVSLAGRTRWAWAPLLSLIDIPFRRLLFLSRHFEDNRRTSSRRRTFITEPSEERDIRVPTGTTSYHDTGSPKVHSRSYPQPAR